MPSLTLMVFNFRSVLDSSLIVIKIPGSPVWNDLTKRHSCCKNARITTTKYIKSTKQKPATLTHGCVFGVITRVGSAQVRDFAKAFG